MGRFAIVYAALALNHQAVEAAQERQELLDEYRKLPKGFKNDWTYTGTRNYIERAATASDKQPLLDALNQIERSK